MNGENQYACPTCGVLRDATKNDYLRSLPKNLVFQLKRLLRSGCWRVCWCPCWCPCPWCLPWRVWWCSCWCPCP